MQSTDTPKAAIVIAAYNAEATIARAVESALNDPDIAEVCVVDDASKDATADAARACDRNDGRLTVRRQSVNAGPSAARNVAIEATRSPWIGILDADDYVLPGRTAALLSYADRADFLADTLLRVKDGADAPAATQVSAEEPTKIDFEAFVLGNLSAKNGALQLGFLKPLMRRAFLEEHQLRYRADMRLGEDYELYARGLALGARFLVSRTAGYVSVARAGSLSAKHSEEDLRLLRDCDQDLGEIPSLSPGDRRALARHTTSMDCRLQWRLLINAVKAKDLGASIRTFRSPQTAVYLAARLGEQAWLRSRALASGRPRADEAR